MPSVTRSQADHSVRNSAAEGMVYGLALMLRAVAGVCDSNGKVKGGRSRSCSASLDVERMRMERRFALV